MDFNVKWTNTKPLKGLGMNNNQILNKAKITAFD